MKHTKSREEKRISFFMEEFQLTILEEVIDILKSPIYTHGNNQFRQEASVDAKYHWDKNSHRVSQHLPADSVSHTGEGTIQGRNLADTTLNKW